MQAVFFSKTLKAN